MPFARELNGALMFDGAAAAAASEQSHAETQTRAEADEGDDDRELCPAPGPDNPGVLSATARAKAYQQQISRMINGDPPLKIGEARNLIDPHTGKVVHFDEYDEQTGTMIEAKGPGIAGILGFASGRDSETKNLVRQSGSQVAAAGTRSIIWYFAESAAAQYAADLFREKDEGRERIIIKVVPAEVQ